ncbi:MAG: c-type cytochrome [Nitrospinae bacterium]|nr:c-type cytochrome [Nitrospinota bacterium]
MKKIFSLFIVMMAVIAMSFGAAFASDTPTKPKLPNSPENVAKGKLIYFKRCSFCHGLKGDGDGPVARQLHVRPRDFTKGLYKFRTTESGSLPLDEDLFRTISRGLPGSAMQTFDVEKVKSGLSEDERWQVIQYIKTFSADFADASNDPTKMVVKVGNPIATSPDSIAKGKKLFEENRCWECHGHDGRGNGPNSIRLKDKFRADPIVPADLSKFWRYKGGNTQKDVYMRFNTGLNGTPMPSFTDSITEEDRWHLANFVVSLQKKGIKNDQVLKAKLVKGELPLDAQNPAWKTAEPIDVRLAGQVIWRPRWENPSVDLVTVQAIYNDKEVAFRFEWDDRTKDTVHNPALEYKVPADYAGYASWEDVPRKLGNFRDSLAIQFPSKPSEGNKKPHFLRGDGANPVNLWVWKSDLEEAGQPSVENVIAKGPDSGLTPQAADDQIVKGKGVYLMNDLKKGNMEDFIGTYTLVMKRPLTSKVKSDVQFELGKFVPFSLNAWDGANGEQGLMMSLSTWNSVILEAPVPTSVYVYTVLGIILMGGIEFVIVRGLKKED